VGLEVLGELVIIVGSDDGLDGMSVGLTDGVGVEALGVSEGLDDEISEGLIEGENTELDGTRVKAVGPALGTFEGDDG
jgi:hypothetical protein